MNASDFRELRESLYKHALGGKINSETFAQIRSVIDSVEKLMSLFPDQNIQSVLIETFVIRCTEILRNAGA